MSTAVFEPARVMIETIFKNGWSTRTPIKYENVFFNQPANLEWVSISIRWGESQQVSIGPTTRRVERNVGVVMLQLFSPKGDGRKRQNENIDFAAALFRLSTQYDETNGIEIEFRTPQVTYVGESKELLQDNLTIPFQLDSLF